MYSVEIDNYDPMSIANCLQKMASNIPDFDYEWKVRINAGGIDYGIYFNIDVDRKELEISNQPRGNGDDMLDDVFELFEEEDDE